jgi:excisionase family DNA binding protein
LAENFLTVAEVAERLKINAQTVRNWLDRGELPAIRVGARRVRIRESDFEAFLAAGELPAVADSAPRHAETWKDVRLAVNAASAAARLRDQAALRAAISALSCPAEQLGSAD